MALTDNRALVLGAGRMGTFHARILRDLGYDVTTCDPDPSNGADLRGYAAGMWRGAAAVAIAVPVEHAAEEASRWAGFAGHLLLEKPFARTSLEADALMTELIGVKVGVGYVERFNPQAQRLKAWGEGRVITDAVFTRWNLRPSPDVPLDLASHDVDLTHWLGLECEPTYRTWADASRLVRRITLTAGWPDIDCTPYAGSVDLTAHNANPLREQWKSFLADEGEIATMYDAAAVLAALGR